MESLSVYPNFTLPFFIFIARILDVSMGTIRIILISKNRRCSAAVLSFFEIAIWITAISNMMNNLDKISCCIAYALGYSAGVYLGMYIEEKVSGISSKKWYRKSGRLMHFLPLRFLSHKIRPRLVKGMYIR